MLALGMAGQARAAESPASVRTPAVSFGLLYKADVLAVVRGGVDQDACYLHNLILTGDVDLDRIAGWPGATVHVDVMHNAGGPPSDLAGSLLGLDNDEAAGERVRLIQAWAQQTSASGRWSLLAGFFDLSTEFDVADSAGLLLSSSFGATPEFASSGPGGPSIWPSPGLAARVRLQPTEHVYLQAAVANADARTIGDVGGPDLSFGQGVLIAAEAGYTGRGKLAVGAWGYSRRQPDLRPDIRNAAGRRSHGLYIVAEQPLGDTQAAGRQVSLFLKAGLSDGDTTAFSGSVQAGALVERVFAGRPASVLSAGISHGVLTGRFRANGRDAGQDIGPGETLFEIAYADQAGPHLTVQPDLQWVVRPSGDRSLRNAVIVGMRTSLSW